MIFIVDAQLPPALVRWLIEQGHSAEHVEDVGLREADDIDIWNYAASTNSIIITKDEDFAERTGRTATGPVIIWLRIGNATNRVLLGWLTPRWDEVMDHVKAGDRLIEVR